MKRSIKIVALVMAALMLCVAFAGCSKTPKRLSGKYSADVVGTGTTLTFEGRKNVTLAFTVLGKELATIEGTYKIDDDKITFDFVDDDKIEDEDVKELLEDWMGDLDFKYDEDHIKIGKIKYELKEE